MARVGFISGALALALLGACSDDEEPAAAVSQEEYDAEAERLCNQHGATITEAYTELVEDSDAEEAAFYTSDFIPRARALLRGLNRHGLPDGKSAEYVEALNEGMAILAELEADPYGYIDHRHAQKLSPEEDLLNRFRAELDKADVPC